jgi:hypothetical protein
MQDNNDRPTKHGAAQEKAAATGLASSTRRRALLKGLGKGAALAGAAAPLASLATSGQRLTLKKPYDTKNYLCTVSGQMSVLLSGGAALPPQCSGYACSHYKNRTTWPVKSTTTNKDGEKVPTYGCKFGTIVRYDTDKFSTCFGSGSDTPIGKLIDKATPDDESYWVCAVLNANVKANDYPYSASECVDQYKKGGSDRSSAKSFHQLLANQA